MCSIFFQNATFADDTCAGQNGYSLYTCRVENICEQYKSEKPVYNSESYSSADGSEGEYHGQLDNAPALTSAKKLYRENMNNIYKCAMIQSQRNTLSTLTDMISLEASGQLGDTIWGQITERIHRLELSGETLGCSFSDEKSIQNKLNILNETSYEACKYTSYLEYLRVYYQNFANNIPENSTQTSFPIGQFPAMINGTQDDIAQEIAHTYQIFPYAYQAYSEYENYYPIHFMLEVIRGDFIILRQRLYETLMPMAQLAYKVINAMSY